ncbi:MAG TPA: di-heme oxidoredictase family protein [Polyangiaceae bacterium]|nr:di-heme oxidoredictase family protein [Polyangiaceae bacterium]
MQIRLFVSHCSLLAVSFSAVACAGAAEEAESRAELAAELAAESSSDKDRPQIGDTLPGTDPVAFAEALDAFAALEDIDEGLGPTFNETGCGACHTLPVVGGSGVPIERRFGRLTAGVFFGFDTPPEDEGGTLRQLFSNGTYLNGAVECTIPVEVTPASANVRDVGRRTTPLFGLGLVDAMPDAFFDALAAAQPAAIRGVVQRVPIALPDPRDPTQTLGGLRVGRFGWKGGIPSLLVFSGDAYDNEMGITTQSCVNGVSVLAFAGENHPNNVPPPDGCNGGDLAPPQPDHPDVPTFTDDAVGPCDGGRSEIQDDLVLFTTFMESLAPPPRDMSDRRSVEQGERLFKEVGCADCHVTTTFRTPDHPFNGVPGKFKFQPFSDFLAHDMGALGDGIGNTGDSVATTRLMRTSPLWGARFNPNFLHDGRAATIEEAILAHDGQGAASRDGFSALQQAERRSLVKFVNSL